MGDEGAHGTRLGERQRLLVVGLGYRGIKQSRAAGDVTEQALGMCSESRVILRRLDRTICHVSCFIVPAQKQTGTPQRVVVPAPTMTDPFRRLRVKEFPAFPDPVQRFALFAELCQGPSEGGGRGVKLEENVRPPTDPDPALD